MRRKAQIIPLSPEGDESDPSVICPMFAHLVGDELSLLPIKNACSKCGNFDGYNAHNTIRCCYGASQKQSDVDISLDRVDRDLTCPSCFPEENMDAFLNQDLENDNGHTEV